MASYRIEAIRTDHPSLFTSNFEACAVARCRESGSSPWRLSNDCGGLPTNEDGVHLLALTWRSTTTQNAARAEKSYQDERVTEDGAVGVCAAAFAALAEGEITEVTHHGTGVDYWVGQRRAVLEVSGIRARSSDTLNSRHAEKKRQLLQGSLHQMGFPGYVFVVSFGDKKAKTSYHP